MFKGKQPRRKSTIMHDHELILILLNASDWSQAVESVWATSWPKWNSFSSSLISFTDSNFVLPEGAPLPSTVGKTGMTREPMHYNVCAIRRETRIWRGRFYYMNYSFDVVTVSLVSISSRFFCYWGDPNNKRTAEKSTPMARVVLVLPYQHIQYLVQFQIVCIFKTIYACRL